MPPNVLVRMVEAAGNPDVETAELADLIGRDPVLSADLLRAAASPLYAVRGKVTTVARAMLLLGLNRVRNLVLRTAVRELVPAERVSGFPLERFWRHSLRRAVAAKAVASRAGSSQDQVDTAFTVALCQDIGVLLSALESRSHAQRQQNAIELPCAVRLYLEQQVGRGHNELGADLLDGWGLPAEIVEPIRYHHWPDGAPDEARPLASICLAAEMIADLFFVEDKGLALSLARQRLGPLGVDAELLAPIVDQVNEESGHAADLLGLSAPEQADFAAIVQAAAEALEGLQSSVERSSEQLRQVLAEKLRLVDQLSQANAQLSLKAATDPLTGLKNRRAFEDALVHAIAQADRRVEPLSLLMIDIDHFKQINDTHGHPVGDTVLKRIAATILRSIRKADIAARYGGEEFVVILPFTSASGGQTLAERLRRVIQALGSDAAQEAMRVTVSIGGATLDEPATDPSGRETVKRADRALYQAKANGRNRIEWHVGSKDRAARSGRAR